MEPKYEECNKLEYPLNKPLPATFIDEYLRSPYFLELLYHGLFKFTKESGERYKEGEYISKGDTLWLSLPELDGGDKSQYLIDVNMEGDFKSVVYLMILSGRRSGYTNFKVTWSYNASEKNPSVGIVLQYTPMNGTVKNLTHQFNDLPLKRAKKLGENFAAMMANLKLIGSANYTFSDQCNFHGMPYGLTTKFVVNKNIRTLAGHINKNEFIQAVFPGSSCKGTNLFDSPDKNLNVKDKFHIDFSNMNYSFEKVSEKLKMCLKSVGNRIDIVSDNNASHFDKIGCSFFLKELDADRTELSVGVFYNRSYQVAGFKAFHSLTSYLTDEIPDPQVFLMLRARNMLETMISHTQQYCATFDAGLTVGKTEDQKVEKVLQSS